MNTMTEDINALLDSLARLYPDNVAEIRRHLPKPLPTQAALRIFREIAAEYLATMESELTSANDTTIAFCVDVQRSFARALGQKNAHALLNLLTAHKSVREETRIQLGRQLAMDGLWPVEAYYRR